MRALLLLVLCPLLAARAADPAPTEKEAYSMVCRAREAALRTKTIEARRGFEAGALGYLTAFPEGPHAEAVQRWLACLRAPRSPPGLDVDRWVGARLERAPGEVTALVFFSVTHPQSAWLLPRLVRLQRRLPVRLAGIAAVIDDEPRQAPEFVEGRLRAMRLPFPVAVDRGSSTFRRFGGASLPWVVLIDRYGRLAWSGDARYPTRLERKLKALLAQPRLDELAADIREGRAAVAQLAAIETKAAVTALFELLPEAALHGEVREALERLGPQGYDLAHPAAAAARWQRERTRYEFSENARRVVRR